MHPKQADRGIALAFALAALALIYLLAAGGFALSRLENRISEAHRTSVEAFYAADGALQAHLGRAGRLPYDEVWTYPDRDVRVTSETLLELPGGDRIVRVTARAAARGGDRDGAARTVSRVVLSPAPGDLPAALVALAGVELSGSEVHVNGEDAAEPPCPPVTSGAGLLAGAEPAVGDARITGTPPVLAVEEAADRAALWRLEWPAPLLESPDLSFVEPGGDPEPLSGGIGLLVASGDLELSADFSWRGLVLVGGALRAAEGVRIEGGAVTGLNLLLGEEPPPSRLGPGSSEILRHSCHLVEATTLLEAPAPVPGTWSEAF